MRQPVLIERIRPPAPEVFVRDYVRASRPVIIRGAIDHWPALAKWTPDYFRERFGDRDVPAAALAEGVVYSERSGVDYRPVNIATYVQALEGGAPLDRYMVFRVHEHAPELFDDIDRTAYTRRAAWFRSRFWFASPKTKSPLHRDLPDNLYAQIRGHKEFILLDRRATRRVHRHPLYSGVPNYSPVDAFSPDLVRHPRFRDAPSLLARLEPGDLLFIPSLWWHQARSEDVSISVNLWWAPPSPLALAIRAAEWFAKIRDLRL